MENNMEGMEIIKMATEKVNEAVEKANIIATESMLQFDTMAQLQKEERTEAREMYAKERAEMRKHYRKIIVAISLVLLLIVGSLIGGLIYLFSNYDFDVQTYQEVHAEGGGNSTIDAGIRVNQYPTDSDQEE